MTTTKKTRQKQESFLFVLMGLILLGLLISGYFLFVDKILPGISGPRNPPGPADRTAETTTQAANPQVVPTAEGMPLAEGEGQVITLYFPSRRDGKLIREIRKVPAEKLLLAQAETLVRELLRGPLTPDARSCLPTGTQLRSLFFHQGIFYVDFSREFLENAPGGVLEDAMAAYSVVNTLTELDRKARVRILVNGSEVEPGQGHVGLSDALTRLEGLIAAAP
ncbi:MAG: GerMN domain-containing protein [Candidatus Riflebacteria bacterium]|nr:GerMN domain-containing protein [Candidatus Riflebacteria bacterium]